MIIFRSFCTEKSDVFERCSRIDAIGTNFLRILSLEPWFDNRHARRIGYSFRDIHLRYRYPWLVFFFFFVTDLKSRKTIKTLHRCIRRTARSAVSKVRCSILFRRTRVGFVGKNRVTAFHWLATSWVPMARAFSAFLAERNGPENVRCRPDSRAPYTGRAERKKKKAKKENPIFARPPESGLR